MHAKHRSMPGVFPEIARPLRATPKHTAEELIQMREQTGLVALDVITRQALPQSRLTTVVGPVHRDGRTGADVGIDQRAVELTEEGDRLAIVPCVVQDSRDGDAIAGCSVVACFGCVHELDHKGPLCVGGVVAVDFLGVLIAQPRG